MKTSIRILILACFDCVILFVGCKKEDDFLNAKPNQALVVPGSLSDLQLLLKNESIFNRNYPSLGESSTDDMMLDAGLLASDVAIDRNVYLWDTPVYPAGTSVNDWNYPYQLIYYANTILTQLPRVGGNSQTSDYKQVQGSALFFRALAEYNLLQVFAGAYRKSSALSDLGVPMPTTPNLDVMTPRSTQEQCYNSIISDLNQAYDLLPATFTTPLAPSKVAVAGLLSRLYLIQGNYGQSLKYATNALSSYSKLQDLNKLPIGARIVYPNFSPEEIFHAGMLNYMSNGKSAQVNSDLYKLFTDPNDLRLKIYFRKSGGLNYFNSQFDRKNNLTYSISTAELYLTKAECEARQNDVTSAITDLNTLLASRWITGSYKPIITGDQITALNFVLTERRKELALTGLRWSDLKRLNQDPSFAITLTRNVSGQIYTLPPNDPRYALPIPDNEIKINPIPQNNR